MQSKVMVSIYCMAYNHEKYIADAIESFLMQKTNFAYEILIHDDASTDRTAEIIKEYTSRYPDLMKPIYQTENQYSKGARPGKYNRERAQGKYMAICEGDDYWTDPFKLQKQVDYMEKHPECSLCVHAAFRVSPDKTKLKSAVRPNQGNKLFTTEEVILGGGGLFATNSIMYPSVFKNRPGFFLISPVGDYPLAIYLALQGTVYYIDEFMSAYRVGVPGSWTNRMASSSIEKRIEHINKIAKMLNEVNSYSGYKYDSAITQKININKMNIMLEQGMYKEVKSGELKYLYDKLDTKTKTKYFIKHYFPHITLFSIKLKRKFGR
ncbi:MAG: glycosyltransferase family 2 protein [Clostridiaceae bacterium]|nr:glycosyltransferase family 2 protein [Clostridiaceae bacterium]